MLVTIQLTSQFVEIFFALQVRENRRWRHMLLVSIRVNGSHRTHAAHKCGAYSTTNNKAAEDITMKAGMLALGSLVCAITAHAGDPFEKQYPNIVLPVAQFGEYGRELGQFNEPGGIAVSEDRRIYIAECFNRRIQVVDDSGRTLLAMIGTAEAPMRCPIAVALTDADSVIVGDRDRKLLEFSLDGKFVRALPWPAGAVEPTDLAVAGNRLLLVDQPNDRVLAIDLRSASVQQLPSFGKYRLHKPKAVTVDDAGSIYVVDARHRVVKFSAELKPSTAWGRYGSFSAEFVDPSDIAFAAGRIYVSDQTNHRMQVFTTSGEFVLQWGRHPNEEHQGRGHTHYPGSIAVDERGTMAVVCEPFEYRCQVFDVGTLRHVAKNDVSAWWEKFPQFHYGGGARILRAAEMKSDTRKQAAALSAHDVLVITEPDLHRVVVFAIPEGKELADLPVITTIGRFGDKNGEFVMIAAKDAQASGSLWVGDAGRNNVQEFNLFTGKYVRTLFGPGTGPGQFRGPSDFEFQSDGSVFIGDFHNDRIQLFDSGLKYAREFGGTGSAAGKFFGPMSMKLSNDGTRLYVSDSGNQRVQVLSAKTGEMLAEIGRLTRPGEWGNGTFQWPFDIAISPIDGSLYVTDPSLQLVQKFSAEGKFITQWGGWGTQPGQFYKPKGIDVDSQGRVFVIDFGNHRGQIFDADGKFLAIFGEGVLYPAKKLEELKAKPASPDKKT